MPIAHALLASLLLMTSSSSSTTTAPSSAEDFTHRVVGPAAELSHATHDLWRAALTSRKTHNPDQDALVSAVFAFVGASDLAASRLASHDCTREESDEILRDLDALGPDVDRAIDQAPTTGELRRAWDATRTSWRTLKDRAAGVPAPLPASTTTSTTNTGAGTSTTTTTTQPGSATGATGATAAEMSATITEARWSGLMNPDLRLAGTFEGRGLVKGEIQVQDEDGKTVYTNTDKLTSQVAMATSGKSTSSLVTVNWTYNFENEDLAEGENTITVSVTNSKGARAWTKRQIVRKQF